MNMTGNKGFYHFITVGTTQNSTVIPMLNVTGNDTDFSNMTTGGDRYLRDKSVIILVTAVISIIAVITNLSLITTILSQKSLRSVVFFWNVVGMSVTNIVFGVIVTSLGDTRHVYWAWMHGLPICKVYALLRVTSFHIMCVIQIILVVGAFLKVKQELSPNVDVSKFKTVIPYILFAIPWLVELILLPIFIVGEKPKLPSYLKFYELMCYHILDKEFRKARTALTYIFTFTLLLATIIFVIYYIAKKASYDRLLNDDVAPRDSVLDSLVRSTCGSSVTFLVTNMPFLLTMLAMISCRSCRPSFEWMNIARIIGCMAYAFTPLPWFAHDDIRLRFLELLQNVTGKIRAACVAVQKCCNPRLKPITVEWSSKQSEVVKNEH